MPHPRFGVLTLLVDGEQRYVVYDTHRQYLIDGPHAEQSEALDAAAICEQSDSVYFAPSFEPAALGVQFPEEVPHA